MECFRIYTTTTRVTFPVLTSVPHRRTASLALRGPPSVVRCDSGGLSAPLEPRTPAGKLLSGVVLNGCDDFHVAAGKELKRLAVQREEAMGRLQLSLGSPEATLHRRIAELKQQECKDEIEDVMYMLIFRKFAEIRVHLIPSLSKCSFSRRIEIWPLQDSELKSIHSFEVLQIVIEHLTASIGLGLKANITDNCAPTQIKRLHLYKLYSESILYGYFLKSATLKYRFEWSLGSTPTNSDLEETGSCSQLPISEVTSLASEYTVYGQINSKSQRLTTSTSQASPRTLNLRPEDLRNYIMGFDPETIQMCANPKSKEALSIIERHCLALFGDERTDLIDADDLLSTSFATLKRFLLEAVAFGSFLWETEKHVSSVYTLDDNYC